MNVIKRICWLIFSFAAVLSSAAEVTILQTTDLHGTMRMPAVAGIIEKERSENPGSLWIDCGDVIQGTPGSMLDRGRGVTAWLNQQHCDVCVPGNHDFDFGPDVFRRHVQTSTADFLAANLIINPAPAKPILPWKMFVRNGIRIAVIGCAPPYLDLWINRSRLQGIRAEMPDAALDRIMPDVRSAKPDLIVLAIHLGEYTAGRLNRDGQVRFIGQFIRRFPEIAIVLGGHTHQTVEGKRIWPDSWFVQAPPHGAGVAKIVVRFDDRTGKISDISSSIIPTDGEKAKHVPWEWIELKEKLNSFNARKVAVLPRKNGREPDTLFARAVRQTSGADAAFCSGSSDRSVTDGVLTEADLFRMMPFENDISILTLNAEQLHAIVLEQYANPPAIPCDGLDCRVALSRQIMKGKKQVAVPVKMEIRYGGKIIAEDDPDFRIRVAFASYTIAGAGGRYPVLKRIAESPDIWREDRDLTVRDAVRSILQKEFPPE